MFRKLFHQPSAAIRVFRYWGFSPLVVLLSVRKTTPTFHQQHSANSIPPTAPFHQHYSNIPTDSKLSTKSIPPTTFHQ
jgi:hypothetical protein